jgi:hypothetical protein
MKRLIGWALAVVLALTGCAATPAQSEPSEPVAPKAAYLAPKEGALLASDDLVAHPEVAVVHDMGTLKTTDAPQVWIDKACLDIADREGGRRFHARLYGVDGRRHTGRVRTDNRVITRRGMA